MSLRHRAQLLKMLKRRKCRLFHPIDGPGVVLLKNFLPHLIDSEVRNFFDLFGLRPGLTTVSNTVSR